MVRAGSTDSLCGLVFSRMVRGVSTGDPNFGGAVLEVRGSFSDSLPCAYELSA
jgi:hypothetical protein